MAHGMFIPLDSGRDFSRILYSNPVCFLCTHKPGGSHNVMTISWLMPMNNGGLLAFSINRARFSAVCLEQRPDDFVLCVPTSELQDLVLTVGKHCGRGYDKFEFLRNVNEFSP